MIYLFDANILIEAKNRYYGLDFAPGFWEFIERESAKVTLKSNDMVLAELRDYKDELSDWVRSRDGIFDISSDAREIQANFKKIADFVSTHTDYSDAEKAHFLSKADPWLIAAAIYLEGVVVTHEKRVGGNSTKVKIPNVAHQFDVATIDTFEMMRRLGGTLELQP